MWPLPRKHKCRLFLLEMLELPHAVPTPRFRFLQQYPDYQDGCQKPSALDVSKLLLSSRWPDFGAPDPDGESAIGSVGRRHGSGPGKVASLQGMFLMWTFELEGRAACNPVGTVGESLVTV